MMKRLPNRLPATLQIQRGYIMLALLLIMILGASSLVLSGLSNRQSSYLKSQMELQQQLGIAKSNLLAYIGNSHSFYDNVRGPGFFPCPDTDNDGDAETSCNPANSTLPNCSGNTSRPAPLTGWLPETVVVNGNEMTLSNYLQDEGANENDQQFWYVVAPRYVYHSSSSSVRRTRNRTSTATSGISPLPSCMRMYLDNAGEYVAFIIAPGEALGNQTRSATDASTAYANYLDGDNGDTNYYFYTSDSDDPENFNDRIIGITLDEYIKTVGMRVAIEMKEQLDAYYPTPATDQYPSSTTLFRQQMDDTTAPADHVWLRPSGISGNNGEIWSTDTTYVRNSYTKATINFSGCTGIKFVITTTSIGLDPNNNDSC